jgi:hypothetical protein
MMSGMFLDGVDARVIDTNEERVFSLRFEAA